MRTIIIATLTFSLVLGNITAQDARSIVQKSLDQVQGLSNYAELKISIIRPSWTRELGIKSWSLGTDYSLLLITSPARDEGTTFLKREDELWNWQPRIERSIKMPPSMLLQSWMGSDFTNDDLVRQSSIVEDYSHKLLKEEAISGRTCYVIELIPKPNAPVVWGKVISWISTIDYLTLKNEFYDEDGFLVNTMIGSEIKRMDDREFPSVMEVFPADDPGNKTRIVYISIDFDIKIDASFFSVQNMRKVQ
jgi:outer membrane lipoprotein-sorting protein